MLGPIWSDPLSVGMTHRVWWVEDALHGADAAWAEALADLEGHAIAFVDTGVLQAWPEAAERLHACMRSASDRLDLQTVEPMPGGEACKDGMSHATRVAMACLDHGVSRRGCVVAMGGGAVLDAVGLGAAMAHRGVPVLRLPTTTLAQDDSAMGVKCGVNAAGQKNALGAFGAPHGVICCERLLASLPQEHWLGGFSEAVKIALLKDAAMLERLEQDAARVVARDMDAARPILQWSAALHRQHILHGGDPFELGHGRPLDHGHWAAHRLEALSGWTLPHGQAVSVGLALDACVAHALGWLDRATRDRVIRLLQALGLPVWHPMLKPVERLLEGLEQFRQHLGGELAVPLLRRLGQAADATALPLAALAAAVETLEHAHGHAVAR
jgi:3-dehydroquinate synthase